MSTTISWPAVAADMQQYLQQFFKTHSNDKLIYHDQSHTTYVVNAATEIANHYQLNERDFFIVLAAAWFHDVGYFIEPAVHEEKGAALAAEFLKSKAVDDATIDAIQKCIMATKFPQQPKNLLEEIVCDADLYHLGTEEFGEKNKLMRKEAAAMKGIEISGGEWRKQTIKLFESHHYHTDYCKLLLNDKKQENLERLKKKDGEKTAKQANEMPPVLEAAAAKEDDANKKEKKARKEEKSNRPDRGIETMFRISSGNHQRLSDQADGKANILITVNSIIISVLLSVLLRSLDQYPYLTIPAMLLLTVNVTTIICAIIATRPVIPSGTFTEKDIDEKRVNLLFFGNFYRMSLGDYAGGMIKMMDDREFLYGSLIRDLYFQGIALGRKYKMMRTGYTVFMFGLIVSVLAFVIATVTK